MIANFKMAILMVAMVLVAGLAFADDYVVVKVKRRNLVTDPTVQLLTLASGAQVTVKIFDIEHDVTRELAKILKSDEVAVLKVLKVNGDVLTLASEAQLTVKRSDIRRDAKLADAIRAADAARAAAVPKPADPEGARLAGIQRKCEKEWPKDAQQRANCQKKQQEALAAIRARSVVTYDQLEIRSLCVRGWSDDYVGQNSCEEQRMGWLTDGKIVRTAPAASTSDSSPIGIRQKCEKEWPKDFQMRVHCEDQQQKAFSALQSRSMATTDQQTIRSECARQWSDDYQMRNHCEEQQLKALKELGR